MHDPLQKTQQEVIAIDLQQQQQLRTLLSIFMLVHAI